MTYLTQTTDVPNAIANYLPSIEALTEIIADDSQDTQIDDKDDTL